MLFGQAGMLEEENDDHYYRLLQREYDFLRHKFGLSPMEDFVFKNLRTRPVNFPYLKVAQLAALWVRYDTLFLPFLKPGAPERSKSISGFLHPVIGRHIIISGMLLPERKRP